MKGLARPLCWSISAPKQFKHKLSVCAIMKDEGSYLKEWIEFHLKVGVEKFYLYLNNCTDNTEEILQPYVASGVVDAVVMNGEKMQIPAYEHCVRNHHNDTRWLAFIDLDEFIVPCKDDNINNVLDRYAKYSQVSLNWVIFGSNGHDVRTPGTVVERFTRCGTKASHLRDPHLDHEKSIVNPRRVFSIDDPHYHFVAGKTIRLQESEARVHHYHCKSWEEYSLRASRGDAYYGASSALQKYRRSTFDAHNLNEVEDKTALPFVLRCG